MDTFIPIGCFVVPLIIGIFAMHKGLTWLVPILFLVFALSFVWAIWKSQNALGWDGLGYAIMAFLIFIPAMLGTALGGVIGWVSNRKTLAAGRTRD